MSISGKNESSADKPAGLVLVDKLSDILRERQQKKCKIDPVKFLALIFEYGPRMMKEQINVGLRTP